MEISSSSSTSCFDLALDDYLHLHHMSSSSSIRCFDLALDYLAKFENPHFYWNCDIELLKAEVKLLKTIFLFVRQCRRRRRNHEALLEHDQEGTGNTMYESLRPSIICFRIQHLVTRIINDLHLAYLRYEHSCKSDGDIIESVVTRSQKNSMLFLETDIKKSCTRMLLDYYSPGDPQLVMDLISSIFLVLKYILCQKRKKLVESLRKKLTLLKDLIGFATMRGVEGMQIIDLLTHTAIVAASLISVCRFERDEEQVLNDMEFKISQLIHNKINPLDPQVREIYIHALTASKLQRSSYGLAAKGNKYAMLDFIAFRMM